jgi:hypothetical protein
MVSVHVFSENPVLRYPPLFAMGKEEFAAAEAVER